MGKNTLLLGTRKGLVVYKRSNGAWKFDSSHFAGIPVTIAAADSRTGSWWALQDHGHWGGKIHRSDDEGKTWKELTPPVYPEGEEVKEGVPASIRYLWAFAQGGPEQDGKIYVGTEPGGLFVSEDNGGSFELVRSLWDHPTRTGWFGGGRDNAGIHSVVVDPRDSDHIYIGISCAGVFETTDGCKTWTIRNKGLKADFLPDPDSEVGQDPHILVACPSSPDYMWQQNHCGIYRSVDGGKQWEDVGQKGGPAHFGFCIEVAAENPDTAWVVPAVSDETRVAIDHALTVCRTTDGGKSWQDFRNGLPQQGAYDIVFRHALAVNGDEVAFGTTTGNFFLSGDGGENWQSLSNYLPMIHSVEFV